MCGNELSQLLGQDPDTLIRIKILQLPQVLKTFLQQLPLSDLDIGLGNLSNYYLKIKQLLFQQI